LRNIRNEFAPRAPSAAGFRIIFVDLGVFVRGHQSMSKLSRLCKA
jgi:hypothetical protein